MIATTQPRPTVAPDVWRHALAIRRLYDMALWCAEAEEDDGADASEQPGQEERPDSLALPGVLGALQGEGQDEAA
jgi:hypothetical protein